MNDLTKEELEILKRALNFWVGENAGKIIKEKLQSMIDNYCEHEICEEYEARQDLQNISPINRDHLCEKCGVFYQ